MRRFAVAVLVCGVQLVLPAAARAVRVEKAAPTLAPLDGLAGNYLAGRQAALTKDLKGASTYLQMALAKDNGNADLLARSFILLVGAGEIDRGIDLATRVMRLDGKDRVARLVLAVKAFQDKRFADAGKILDLDDKDSIADITGGLLAAWAAVGAKKPEAAKATLAKLNGPALFTVLRNYHEALMADLAGNSEAAHKAFNIVLSADKAALRVAQAYAHSLAKAGARDAALKVVEDYLKEVPYNGAMTQLAARLRGGDAVELLVQSPTQGAAEVLFGLGAMLAREGGEELAAIYMQLSLYLDKTNALALITLADLYNQMRQYDTVIVTLERVPAASPLKATAEVQIALTLEMQKNIPAALQRLDALLLQEPNHLEALAAKARVLRLQKRYAESLPFHDKIIETAAQAGPRNWIHYYFRGTVFERLKQWDKAEADFKTALTLRPDEPRVLNYLGYMWIDRGVNLDEGMKLLRRAVEQDPNNAFVIDSVGWAYYRMGRYDEALEWLEKAVEKRAGDPVLNDHLGDVYWKEGREREARFQWTHARDLKPEPDDLARIERKLKDGLTPATESANATSAQ